MGMGRMEHGKTSKKFNNKTKIEVYGVVGGEEKQKKRGLVTYTC